MRVTGPALRLIVAAISAGLLVGSAVACTADRPPAASGTGAPPPSPTGATPIGPPPTSGPPRSPTPPRPTPPTTKQPPGTDDLPGPLPLPQRRYTGLVERVGDCTTLLTGGRRVALTGPMADSLRVGQRVTVTGSPAVVPDTCARREAVQAVQVTGAEPA
jgi:hypothetical protein